MKLSQISRVEERVRRKEFNRRRRSLTKKEERAKKRIKKDDPKIAETVSFFDTEEFVHLFPAVMDLGGWDVPTLFFSVRPVCKKWRALADDFFDAWLRENEERGRAFVSMKTCEMNFQSTECEKKEATAGLEALRAPYPSPARLTWYPLDFRCGRFRATWSVPEPGGTDEKLVPYLTVSDPVERKIGPNLREPGFRIRPCVWMEKIARREWFFSICAALGYWNLILDAYRCRMRDKATAVRDVYEGRGFKCVPDPRWKKDCRCRGEQLEFMEKTEAEIARRFSKTGFRLLRLGLRFGNVDFLDKLHCAMMEGLNRLDHFSKKEVRNLFVNWVPPHSWNDAFYGKKPYDALQWLWHYLGLVYDEYEGGYERGARVEPFENRNKFERNVGFFSCLRFNEGLRQIWGSERKEFEAWTAEDREVEPPAPSYDDVEEKGWLSRWLKGEYYSINLTDDGPFACIKLPLCNGVPMEEHYDLHGWLCYLIFGVFWIFGGRKIDTDVRLPLSDEADIGWTILSQSDDVPGVRVLKSGDKLIDRMAIPFEMSVPTFDETVTRLLKRIGEADELCKPHSKNPAVLPFKLFEKDGTEGDKLLAFKATLKSFAHHWEAR